MAPGEAMPSTFLTGGPKTQMFNDFGQQFTAPKAQSAQLAQAAGNTGGAGSSGGLSGAIQNFQSVLGQLGGGKGDGPPDAMAQLGGMMKGLDMLGLFKGGPPAPQMQSPNTLGGVNTQQLVQMLLQTHGGQRF